MNLDSFKTPEELIEYMNAHIEYGFIGDNGEKFTPEDPARFQMGMGEFYKLETAEEVLKNNIGIYFDQVELERAWFKKNGYRFKTIFITINIDDSDACISHTFLIYYDEENEKWDLFEHALPYNRGIFQFRFLNESIIFAVNKFIEANKEFAVINENSVKSLRIIDYREGLSGKDFETITETLFNKSKDITGAIIAYDED